MQHVKFHRMADGDREDFLFLAEKEREIAEGLADRLLASLAALEQVPSAYRVSRLEHCLQCATRAYRDGADEDWIVAALFHDIGDQLAPYNHDELAAAVLKPYLREQCTWTIANHGTFQRYYYAHHFGGDRHLRRKYEKSPYYADCIAFCERWDQASYDPEFRSMPLGAFEEMARAVFSREPYAPAHIAPGHRAPLEDPDVAAARRETVRGERAVETR